MAPVQSKTVQPQVLKLTENELVCLLEGLDLTPLKPNRALEYRNEPATRLPARTPHPNAASSNQPEPAATAKLSTQSLPEAKSDRPLGRKDLCRYSFVIAQTCV